METLDRSEVLAKIAAVPHWYHRFEFAPGVTTPSGNDNQAVLRSLSLPDQCQGIRALDIGTRDGFFAFELRRRGAEVLAVDYMPIGHTGFPVARELLGMDVPYLQENVYNLSPEAHGTFDIVLFLGVLYHLPDPMSALRIVRRLCRGEMFLESQVLDNAFLLPDGTSTSLAAIAPALTESMVMQFYPGTTLNDDATNYWAPSVACLEAMLRENRFAVLSRQLQGCRAILKCHVVDDELNEYLGTIASGTRRIDEHEPTSSGRGEGGS